MSLLLQPPWTRQPPRGVGFSSSWIKPWALFNFAQGPYPPNMGPRAPADLTWGSTTTTLANSFNSVGMKNTNGATFGVGRSFDAFAPASSPACFVWTITHGAYVSHGSSTNIIWTYGTPDSASGFFSDVTSANVLRVRLCDTLLTGPTITDKQRYYCVAGRDAAGACWFWVNGALVATGSGATAAASATNRTLILSQDDSLIRDYQGYIQLFAMSSENPVAFGAELSANPWRIFQPIARQLSMPSAAAGFNAAWASNANAIIQGAPCGAM